MKVQLKLVSSLAKVLHEVEPQAYPRHIPASLLAGELYSLQVAYCLFEDAPRELPVVSIQVDCKLPLTVRHVFGCALPPVF